MEFGTSSLLLMRHRFDVFGCHEIQTVWRQSRNNTAEVR
jgi:hypothetical protein